jgi:hypothetical protein
LSFDISSLRGGLFGLAFRANGGNLGLDFSGGRFVIHSFLQGCFSVGLRSGGTAAASTTSTATAATSTSATYRCRPGFRHCGNPSRDGGPFTVIGYSKGLTIRVRHSLRIEGATAPATTPSASAASSSSATTLRHQVRASQPQRGNTASQDQCFLQYVHTILLQFVLFV